MAEFLDGNYLGGDLEDTTGAQPPQLRVTPTRSLPGHVDLRPYCPPVEDQGQVGSCASNATIGALEYHLRRRNAPFKDLSRLFVYYNARAMQGREMEMHGSVTALNMACTMMYGACPEDMWPYQTALVTTRPTEACYRAAENLKGVDYARLENGDPALVKTALALELPVIFSVQIPGEGYAMGRSGRISRPPGGWWPRKSEGGHAILLVGYDDSMQSWLVRNSWGPGYGDRGYFWLDYEAMELYKRPDFWVIGDIKGQPGLNMLGPSVSEHIQDLRKRIGATSARLDAFRKNIQGDLGGGLDQTRQSIRDRLRGPGVGGGY